MNDWMVPVSMEAAEAAGFAEPLETYDGWWRPVTLEDLGGLGEKKWRCELMTQTRGWTSYRPTNCFFGGRHSDDCGWRIIIPLPQMVAE